MKTALLFSGQGSQYPGMLCELVDAYPAVREVFGKASALLGRDVYSLTMEGPQEELDRTENTQPCLLACELAALRVLRELELPFDAAAGFSLGEWAALTACGAADEDGVLGAVVCRASAMARAVPAGTGAMAVILGKSDDFVRELCLSVGDVVPANYNCPGNITVAGSAQAVERLLQAAAAQGAAASRVNMSVPSHCPLMAPAAEELRPVLRELPLQMPQKELVMNAVGLPVKSVPDIRRNLSEQLTRPVRFRQSVEHLLSEGYDTFVEVGPGKTLSNMVRRTAKQAGASVELLQFNSLAGVQRIQERFHRQAAR